MAKITTTQEVCDLCKDPRRQVAMSARITIGNMVTQVVLCRQDAAALEMIVKAGTTRPMRKGSTARVWTMEEIEREKARQNAPRSAEAGQGAD